MDLEKIFAYFWNGGRAQPSTQHWSNWKQKERRLKISAEVESSSKLRLILQNMPWKLDFLMRNSEE